MTEVFRDSLTGRYTTEKDAAARPAETTAEHVPTPPDVDALGERLYQHQVTNGLPWNELSQERRDEYRAAVKLILSNAEGV